MPERTARYQSVCPWLKERGRLWRDEVCPRYGFGRHELMPIRTQANAVARYLGGYIRNQIENRNEVDKGSRLVRYIGFGPGERTHYPTFVWVLPGRPWRQALGEFAPSQGCYEFEDLAHKFGKAWSWG